MQLGEMMSNWEAFQVELERLINQHSLENGSNTPNFILADYLKNCLLAFNNATAGRERWYGRDPLAEPSERKIIDELISKEEARQHIQHIRRSCEAFVRCAAEFDDDPNIVHERLDALDMALTSYGKACSGE